MKKRIFFSTLGLCFTLTSVAAQIKPLVTLNLGVDVFNQTQSQNITLLSPFYNTYSGGVDQNKFVGGILVGFQAPVTNALAAQLGISYYQNNSIQARGTIYQFGDPAFGNLGYQYNIKSQRIYAEGKVLTTWHKQFHPFISGAVGQARNKAYRYHEFILSSDAALVDQLFLDHSTNSFSYLLGLGIENELTEHIRLGCSYRWVNLNKVELAGSAYQESPQPLHNNPLHVNEFLIQLSYLG